MNCAICLTNEINTIILPCYHMCICSLCCEDLKTKSKKCPICRKGFYFVLNIFFLVIDSFLKLSMSR